MWDTSHTSQSYIQCRQVRGDLSLQEDKGEGVIYRLTGLHTEGSERMYLSLKLKKKTINYVPNMC